MDGVKIRRERHSSSRPHARSTSSAPRPTAKQRHDGERYFLVRSLGKMASKRKQRVWDKFRQTEFAQWPDKYLWRRIFVLVTLGLFLFSTIAGILQPLIDQTFYNVTPATRGILPKQSENLAKSLKFNAKEEAFLYNEGYKISTDPNSLKMGGDGNPRFSASMPKDPTKGVSVTDPVNTVDFKLIPKFPVATGKQDKNQVFYPLGKMDGYLVYTAQTASIKEDIVLQSKPKKDKLVFEYELSLAEGLEARMEKNGSVGIYGSDLPLYGNVATGSDKDAELLQKTRQNAPKTKFLFGVPAPVIKEAGKNGTVVNAKFELNGKSLKVVANGLQQAAYPLTIDPSIYIQSAAQLMYGNNETNVEFDVATEQFKKGTTTGARIDSWTDTTDMPNTLWDQGTTTSGSYVYTAGGRTARIKPRIMDVTTTQQSTDSTTFTMNMPTNRPAGDLYIAVMCHDGAGTNLITPPAGWTEYADLGEHAAYYWVGTGTPSATYQWSKTATEQWAGAIIRVKDFDITSPVTSTASSASNVTPTYPSITAGQEGTLMISSAGVDQDNVESSGYSPTGFSDLKSLHSDNNASVNGCGFFSSEYYNPPRSGVPTGSATLNTAANDTYGSSSISIRGVAVTTALKSSVQWAHFNNTTKAVESTAPGSDNVSCSGWCTNSAYDLPAGAGKVGMAMVAYNGYLYVIGGNDGTNVKSAIYIAKLGANGEPQLWHPTNASQGSWSYWYADTGLSSARQYLGAYAYNGKMYVLGGDTNTTVNSGATNIVQLADILPNGTLGSWSSGTALPTAAYGLSVQGYNGYVYIIGGSNNGTMISNASSGDVRYTKLNSDGTMNSWLLAAADGTGIGFTTPRESHGGLITGIWGGYLYLAGGCSAVNASDYCTSTLDDVQLASINADGTLDAWNTMSNIKHKRFGSSFVAWQDSLYRFGGCEFQDPSTGECYATHKTIQYGNVNQDGDASTVSISQPSGSGNCIDPDPYNCDLATGEGQMLSTTAILNGYLYNIGGCTNANCGNGQLSGNVSYAAVDSAGRLKSPPSCSGTVSGAWCIDSTNTVSGGIGAAGSAIFGGTLYLIGGLDGNNNKTGVYRNTVNADGSLAGGWTTQTFANIGVTTGVSYTYAYARANPVSAGTYPGNLYIFGGCDASTNAGCDGNYVTGVWKCNLKPDGSFEEADANDCDTANQMQIDSEAAAGSQGLGIHAGTVYANYIYLIGGISPNVTDRTSVIYAKFDNNNNVVAVSGSNWVTSSVEMKHGRRRGTAFGYNGYIYAVGGYDSNSSQILDTIEFVKINVSDGSLVSTIAKDPTNFPGIYLFGQSAVTFNQRWGLGMAVSNSYAYIIGGCKVGDSPNCTTMDSTVQTFQVYNNDSGAPGGYTKSANLYATDRLGAGAAVLNGYMYIAGGCTSGTDCSTVTTDVQRAPIDANGVVGAWTAMTGLGLLPAARGFGQLEVAGGTLYFIGGENGGTAQSNIYYATMGGSGIISTWTGTTRGIQDSGGTARPRTRFSSAVWNNRIYVTGGYDTTPTYQATVYISPQLNSGGDITAAWSNGTSFNVARASHVAITYANNLYILSGYDGTNYLSDVQFAKLDSSTGNISGSWNYSTNIPFGLRGADGFASNGYMYLFGGRTSTNDCTSRTLIAPISANTSIASGNNPTGIGEWYQTNRNFDGGRYGASAVNYQGKAYVLGGGCQGIVMQDDFDDTGSPYYDSSQWTSIANMAADTRCQSTSSSKTLSGTEGGTGGTAAVATTKAVDVSSGGTVFFKLYEPLADVGSPTCYRGEQTTSLLTTTRDEVQLQYSKDNIAWTSGNGGVLATYAYNQQDPLKTYAVTIPAGAQSASTRFRWIMPNGEATDSFALEDVYIIATGNTTISYPADRVAQTALLSQPQVAIYSRLVDAGNDAFPRKFLINGIDNSIGARWQMAYRSMNDPVNTTNPCGGSAMSGYGQLTNFGDVTLGTPGTYTMKNGAGTDIGCGRYFFMTVSIDASQTYGYPDDITRGPTLDNLTLFYNSNPGKRLIHGKTFTEGIQQPLDTQP